MTDAPEPDDGDVVVLLVGDYDPPTLDYSRAVEALCASKGVDQVWACPQGIVDKDRTFALATSFCVDMSASLARGLTCCMAGVGRSPTELREWCSRKYPTLKFELLSIDDVSFAGEEGGKVKVPKFLRVGKGIRERIAAGSDESRSFSSGAWSLIQSRRYYRDVDQ